MNNWRKYLAGLAAGAVLALIGAAIAQQTNYLGAVFVSDPTTPTRQLTVNSDGSINTGLAPSSSSSVGVTPVVSTSAEASHVLKATPGNLYSVYAQNLTSTAGFLQVFNATSAPVDGAVTPLACVGLPAGGSGAGAASIDFGVIPSVYSTGITAVVSSATTCFTKTTSGGLTAFISGSVK